MKKRLILFAILLAPVLSFSQAKVTTVSVTTSSPNYHSIFSHSYDTLFVTDDSLGRAMLNYWISRIEYRKVVKLMPNVGTVKDPIYLESWELSKAGDGRPKCIILVDLICIQPSQPGEQKLKINDQQLLK